MKRHKKVFLSTRCQQVFSEPSINFYVNTFSFENFKVTITRVENSHKLFNIGVYLFHHSSLYFVQFTMVEFTIFSSVTSRVWSVKILTRKVFVHINTFFTFITRILQKKFTNFQFSRMIK